MAAAQARGENPPESRPQGREGTRRRLVEAAFEVFAERGYHAASLAEVAARAGLTTGAVYSAFGSKKALLLAVCSEALPGDEFADMVARGRPLRDTLLEIFTEQAREEDDPAVRRLATMQLEMLHLGTRDSEVFTLLAASARELLADAASMVESLAARDGSRLPLPASDLAVLIAAMQNGLNLVRLVDPGLVPEHLHAAAVDLLLGRRPAVAAPHASRPGPTGGERARKQAARLGPSSRERRPQRAHTAPRAADDATPDITRNTV